MTGNELRAARGALGHLWGLGAPVSMTMLGRILRLRGRDVGSSIRDWERGDGPTGPAALAIELMLDGARPRDLDAILGPPATGRHETNRV